jgi:hypothetical protein
MVKLGIAEEPKAVELAQVKTEDGQAIFEADTFGVGEAVFIVTEDGKIAAPAGEFALEDGNIIEVDENGVIVEISKKEAEIEEEEIVEEVVAEDDTNEGRNQGRNDEAKTHSKKQNRNGGILFQ